MSVVLPEDFANEMRALLVAHPALARFVVRVETTGRGVNEIVADSIANALRSELWIVHDNRTTEEMGVASSSSPVTIIDQFTIAAIDGRRNAPLTSMRLALDGVEQTLNDVLLPSAKGRLTPIDEWERFNDEDADTVQAWTASLRVNYDDVLAT